MKSRKFNLPPKEWELIGIYHHKHSKSTFLKLLPKLMFGQQESSFTKCYTDENLLEMESARTKYLTKE